MTNIITEQAPRHDGENLKQALTNAGWTGRKLAVHLNKGTRTVYDWFSKETLKINILEEVVKTTGIAMDQLRPPDILLEGADGLTGKLNRHHGFNVKSTLNEKGIKLEKFARKMGFTRLTLYGRLKMRTWDEGELLKAAQILQVPVAQLKGKGKGERAFEKDIYDELKSINEKLLDMQKQLFLAKSF